LNGIGKETASAGTGESAFEKSICLAIRDCQGEKKREDKSGARTFCDSESSDPNSAPKDSIFKKGVDEHGNIFILLAAFHHGSCKFAAAKTKKTVEKWQATNHSRNQISVCY